MEYQENRQSFGADFLGDFALELQSVTNDRPLSGAAHMVLAELDAVSVPVSDFDSGMAELDRLMASFGPSEPVQCIPQSLRQSLLERLEASSKIASKSEAEKSPLSLQPHSFLRSPASVCPVRHLHPLSLTPSPTSLNPSIRTIPTKTWRKASPVEKLAASIAAAGQSAHAFTLNLASAQEKALRASKDPTRHISDRINRALKGAGVRSPEYAFSLEVSPVGKLHLHGAIAVPPHCDLSKLKALLMKAGGKLKGHAASRQVCVRPIDDAAGWSGYLQKDLRQTGRVLGLDKLTFISTPLKGRCREIVLVEAIYRNDARRG